MIFFSPSSASFPNGSVLLAGTALFVFGITPAAAQPFAAGRTLTGAIDEGQDVVVADIDGDGDTDVLSASSDDDTVAWYRNGNAGDEGPGSKWTQIEITTAADHATGIAAADIDGDGDTDVLSASSKGNTIAWYRNGDANGGGDGSSWTKTVITGSANGARDVAVADIDGDGDLDVLSAAFRSGTIAWHQNGDATGGGNGASWTTTLISTAADGALSVTPADLDGDGDVDVLSAAGKSSTVSWHQNGDANGEGNGSAWTSTRIARLEGANSVIVEDLSGDGTPDVAAGGFKVLGWYRNARNEPDPSWPPVFIQSARGTNKVLAPDIDGDGDADLLSVNAEGDEVAWYRNGDAGGDGTGSKWTARPIARPNTRARSVSAADLDGDGDLDVLVANDNNITWHENERAP